MSRNDSANRIVEKADFIAKIVTDKGLALNELLRTHANGLLKAIGMEIVFDETGLQNMFQESVYFFLHFVDRQAFKFYGNEKRSILITHLVKKVCELTASDRSQCLAVFNERQDEYGQYSILYSEDSDEEKSTLLWKFCEKLQKTIDAPDNEFVTIAFQTILLMVVSIREFTEIFDAE